MENTFKKILVGFDDSASARIAIEKAIACAERFDSEITAVHVVKSEDEKGKDDYRTFLAELGQRRNISIDYQERVGKVYKEVSSLERELGADLIVVGTHGKDGWQPFWIGSNAFRIVSSSNCPVITIQETTRPNDLSDILLPLDDSDETRQKVPYAANMAKAFGATVHILGVTKSTDAESLARINTYIHQTEKYLDERNIKHTYQLRSGVKIPDAVVEYSKEIRAGLVVIMTETESMGVIMGSYAQDVINNCTAPVMSIHSRDLRVVGKAGY